jgi:hypothetical protein
VETVILCYNFNIKNNKIIMTNKKNLPSISLYKRIAYSFAGLVIVLIILVSYFSFGEAMIKIEPKKQTHNMEFMINVGNKTEATEQLDNFIAGKVLSEVVEKTKSFPTSGKKKAEADGTFVGKINIHNDSDQEYKLVAKTRLLSESGILFRMSKLATIKVGEITAVDVYPDDKNFTGVLEPTSFTIPGLKVETQKLVYGKTTENLVKGGADYYFLEEKDLATAKQELTEELKQEALSKIKDKIKFREKILNEISQINILEEKSSIKVGDIGTNFDLTLKIEVVTISLDEDKLNDDIKLKIIDKLPPSTDLTDFNPEAINYTVEKYDSAGQILTFKVSYTGDIMINKESNIFDKKNLIGLTKKEAVDFYTSFDDVKSVDIKLSPFWVKRIPNTVDNIELILIK